MKDTDHPIRHLRVHLATEQMPRQEKVAHDRMGRMDAEWHRVGLERPHFFGFQPPKKVRGVAPARYTGRVTRFVRVPIGSCYAR
jgi:hypothetical protein